jgi:signal transduction histidine kinase
MARQQEEERVLIVAPIGRDGPLMAELLNESGLDAQICASLAECCEHLAKGSGLLLLTEEALVPGELSELMTCLTRQPAWSDVPLVILTSNAERQGAALRGLTKSVGNVTLLERPMRRHTLLSTLQVALRARRKQYFVRQLLEEQRESQKALAQAHSESMRANAELEGRVEERTRELRETNDQMNSFCYALAHDLRAPLRAQAGFAAALEDEYGPVLGEGGRKYARRIADSADRQSRLLSDLLKHMSLSRADLPMEPVKLALVIDDARKDLEEEIKSKQAGLTVEAGQHKVLANRASLHLVVVNLFSNALKFVAPGVTPDVRIWTEEKGAFLRLSVRDNGIGIPESLQNRIFGVFQRLHSTENYPGTGIGLAIVKKAAERMGGRIGLASAQGKGSTFWVELQAAG